MLHVSDLTLTHFRERPDSNSSQDTAALQPHAHHPLVEGEPSSTHSTISLEEFDQLFLSSVQHRQGPLHLYLPCVLRPVTVNVAADYSNQIASMSIAGTFTFTEVALLECSESRHSKKLRICNSLPKDGKTTMTQTVLTGSARFKQTP